MPRHAVARHSGDYEIYSPFRKLVLTGTYSMVCD